MLDEETNSAANNLFDKLDEHGLFVVRQGELESWLSSLGVTGHKAARLVEVFDRMGDDPTSSSFLKPGAGDVWNFIGKVSAWLQNRQRKGAQ